MRVKIGEEELEVVSIFKREKTKGRPRNVLTEEALALITKLATVMTTQSEIASCLNTTIEILNNEFNRQSFLEAIKKGNEIGKSSLRNAQFTYALKGNSTLLVWLGKQYLGQTDKVEVAGNTIDRDIKVQVVTPAKEDYDRVKKLKENLFKDVN